MAFLRRLLIGLLFPVAVFSQGMRHDNFVLKPLPAGGVTPVSGALITVCTSAGSGTPCAPKVANIYSDEVLSTTISGTGGAGTTNSDANGNYFFYLASGSYVVTVTGSGITSYSYKLTLPCGPAGCGSAAQIITPALSRGGIDIGNEINLAYAALPAAGGMIQIYPKADGSCYNFTTPINLAVAGKYVLVQYMGSAGATGAGAVVGCLNYTPTTSTNALTLDYASNVISPSSGTHGLRNIYLSNNKCTTSGGCGSLAAGIVMGTTNQGAYEATMDSVSVQGFNACYQNLNATADDILWLNPNFLDCGEAVILASPTGVAFIGGTMAGNAVAIQSNGTAATPEIDIIGTQFFGNTRTFDFTLNTSPAQLTCVSCHLEFVSATNAIDGDVNLSMTGGVMEFTGGGVMASMINSGGNNISISDMSFGCSGTCTTIIAMNSPTRAKLGGYIFSPGHFTNLVNGANAAFATLNVLSGSSGTAALPFQFEGPMALGGGQLNSGQFTLSYPSASLNGMVLRDTTLPRTVKFGPGVFSSNAVSLNDVTGVANIWDCYYTNQQCQFKGSLSPITAGAADLGLTSLPFGNLWLGTAATNNLKFQPAAMAAARVLTVPDPLGAVTMPYVIASGTSTLTANAALAAVTSQAAITTAATGTLTTDSVEWSYASAPTAGDSLCHVSPYVTAGNVNFVRTNPTAAAQNVSAIVINWRVIR